MYRDYFTNARFAFAMDILPKPPTLVQERVFYLRRDAYTKESVELMKTNGTRFALIVDDGSHTLQDQIWFCKNYPPLLAPDGLAIVEDIQDEAYLKMLFAAVPSGYCGMAIDQRHVNGRFDDLIFVIWPSL